MLPRRVEKVLRQANHNGIVVSYQDQTPPIHQISGQNRSPIVVSVVYSVEASRKQVRHVESKLEAEGFRPTTRHNRKVVYRSGGASPLYIPPSDPDPHGLYHF